MVLYDRGDNKVHHSRKKQGIKGDSLPLVGNLGMNLHQGSLRVLVEERLQSCADEEKKVEQKKNRE